MHRKKLKKHKKGDTMSKLPVRIRRDKDLKQIMIQFLVFVIFIPMLCFSALSYKIYEKSMENSVSQYSLQLTQQIATNLDIKLSSYQDLLMQVIMDDDIIQTLKSVGGGSDSYVESVRLGTQVLDYVLVNPEFESIAFLTEDQYINTVFRWDGESLHDEIYQKTMTDKNRFQWFGSRVQIYRDTVGTHKAKVFSVSKEVNDFVYGGSMDTVIVVDIQDKVIKEICNKISKEKLPLTWCIADPDGNVVFPGNTKFGIDNINVLFSDEVNKANENRVQANYYAEGDYEGEHLLVSNSGLDVNEWRIITFLDYQYISSEAAKSLRPIISVFMIILVVLSAGMWGLLKTIATPLKQLTSMMKYPVKGDFSHKIEPVRGGVKEIEVLQDSYNYMLDCINRLVDEVYQEGEQKRIVQIKALESQINPHFLYNTLDTIKWTALLQKADNAATMASLLSKLLHISLSKGEDLICLTDEIEHVKAYIGIQRFRLDTVFDVIFVVDPKAEECYVPKIILQPFVENSMLHGLSKGTNGVIEVICNVEEDNLIISVNDNGVGMDLSKSYEETISDWKIKQHFSGIGVKNVDERIKLICGKEYGVTIKSKVGYGTMVTITLPIVLNREGEKRLNDKGDNS